MLFSEFVDINPRISLAKGKEYPCVMMDEVEPGKKFVSGIIRPYNGGSKFKKGDTLFARITPCLENGKIAKYTGRNGELGFGSTEFFVFRNKEWLSDSDYVYYLALADIIRKPAEASMFGASGRQRADLSVIENIEIDPPPLPIQHKIGSILSAYDDLIENNTRRIQILEEMAQRIYREWFVHFRYPGYEEVKMVESELGIIPEGWEVGNVGDIYSVKSGFAFKSKDMNDDGDYGIVKIRNIQPNGIDIENLQYIASELVDERAMRFKLSTGDLLIAMTGAQVGKVGIMPKTKGEFLLNQRVGKFFPNEGFQTNNQFIYLVSKSDDFQTTITNLAQGTAQPNISGQDIESIKLLLPQRNLLKKLEDLCEPIRNEIVILDYENSNLRQTRDLLLPRLISGKIDVSDLDIDVGAIDA